MQHQRVLAETRRLQFRNSNVDSSGGKNKNHYISSIRISIWFPPRIDENAAETVEVYKLIDGLQTQTLRQYTSHPNSAFGKSDLSDELVEFIAQK